MRRSGGTWWGIALIILGILLLLDAMFDLELREVVHTWWPLLLVIWGVSMLMRHRNGSSATPPGDAPLPGGGGESQTGEQIGQSNVFGDVVVRVSSRVFRGGAVSNVFGDIDVDLTNAALAEGDHRLKVNGVFGAVTLHLPRDMAFAASGSTVFGKVEISDQRREGFSPSMTLESGGFGAASRKLHISASQVFGDVVIRN
jgi:predicted membrane protein